MENAKKRMVLCILLVIISSLILGCIEEDNPTPVSITTPSPTTTPLSTPISTTILTPSSTSLPTPTPETTPEQIITYDELPVTKANGNPTVLINYQNAVNPTFDEVLRFLKTDKTDTYSYSETFKCVDFAERIHNNAEAKGIRAGLVTVTFRNNPIGHALNVFNTKDKGIVYIDCTGIIAQEYKEKYKYVDLGYCLDCSFDAIAYVVQGKEYGTASLDITTNIDYQYYEITKYNMEDYYVDIRDFERRLNVYNGNYEEYHNLVRDFENLKSRGQLYCCFWTSDNIVENIEIYW